MIERPTILVDTREQTPWEFDGKLCLVKAATLATGDYSVEGHHRTGVVIERKSLLDLYGSMTSGRVRFLAELARMRAFEYKALIVEAEVGRVLLGSARTMVSPARMVRSVHEECVRHGISLHFLPKEQAEAQAFRLLEAFWSFKRRMGR